MEVRGKIKLAAILTISAFLLGGAGESNLLAITQLCFYLGAIWLIVRSKYE